MAKRVLLAMYRQRNEATTTKKKRIEIPQGRSLGEVISAVEEHKNFNPLNEFVDFLKSEVELTDDEFLRIMNDARKMVYRLSKQFTNLVEGLLALSWTKRSAAAKQAYSEFCIDLVETQICFISIGIKKCISQWIPTDADATRWSNGIPEPDLHHELEAIHELLDRIITVWPIAYSEVLNDIRELFPCFDCAPHIIVGYVHNVFWLTAYQPIFTRFAIYIVVQKMIILDVNAPFVKINDEADMDDCSRVDDTLPMKHPIAHALDICMDKMYEFLNTLTLNYEKKQKKCDDLFKLLLQIFNRDILPRHDTHHVQFLVFYYCSFKPIYAERFLLFLWSKFESPDVLPVLRQAAVGYIASFLARSKFISLSLLRYYLKKLCDWAIEYIKDYRAQYCSNASLKPNSAFFTICQGIFYVIGFRGRHLIADKKGSLFLKNLPLYELVQFNSNPLCVCLPSVTNAFADAHLHSILEGNAIFAKETATAAETLDAFFPFDPYMLKMSGKHIEPHYLQYQASDAKEQASGTTTL